MFRAPVEWGNQARTNTIGGEFRVDFVVRHGDLRVGFECDGAAFHAHGRDRYRDALILASLELDQIVRISGSDIIASAYGCLATLAHFDRRLFPDPALDTLYRLCPKGTDSFSCHDEWIGAVVPDEPWTRHVSVIWRTLSGPSGAWMLHFADFAWSIGGGRLDELIHQYFSERAAASGSR